MQRIPFSASVILTPLPALVPVPVLGPGRGAPDVGPDAVDARVAGAVLDVYVDDLVRIAASQDSGRGRGGSTGRGGRVSLRG